MIMEMRVALATCQKIPEPDLDAPTAYARLGDSLAFYNDVPRAEVVPALGTSHAVFLAYTAMLSPGDEVLLESPGYEPLTTSAQGLGAVVRTFERREINHERSRACNRLEPLGGRPKLLVALRVRHHW